MNLFAYGTLMWPEVLEAVMGRRMTGGSSTLPGYTRLRAKERHYPVVIQCLEDSVEGVLYTGLTEREFQCLDAFEGEEYDRIEVELGGVRAQVYVLSNAWKHIATHEPWTPDQLRPEHVALFR
ncbi:gamma-glutamylcyclotransferase [Pontiellaceae bacterium B12227]|nr:gamma-glutamylcyclotransferase [Pontiellaceae bacterium B12227]